MLKYNVKTTRLETGEFMSQYRFIGEGVPVFNPKILEKLDKKARRQIRKLEKNLSINKLELEVII